MLFYLCSFCVLPIPLFLCKCLNLCSSAAKRKRKMKKELMHILISVFMLLLYQNYWTCFHGGCMSVFCLHLPTLNYFHAWSALAVTCRYLHERSRLICVKSNITVIWLLFLAIILLCVMKRLYCFQIKFLPSHNTVPHSTSVRTLVEE